MKKYKKKENNKIKIFLIKVMVCIMLFLLFLICNKKINNFDSIIYENVYSKNFSFAKFNSWYEKTFGNIFPIKKIEDIQVFNESFVYKSKKEYLDGVELEVDNNYLVPSIKNGIVVFIGEKENYGYTIILEDEDGLDIWYSNVKVMNLKMYDYVNKGDYIGEVKNNKLIMVFKKDGKKDDYQKYI